MCNKYCNECGEVYKETKHGINNHVDSDGNIDHDSDSDHVPYGEEEVQD